MNKKILYLGAAILAISVIVTVTDAQRPVKELNVKEPIDAMKNAWQKFVDAIQLLPLLKLILAILQDCLLPIIIPPATEPPFLQGITFNSSHAKGQLNDPVFAAKLTHLLSQVQIGDILKNVKILQNDCSSPSFKIIHDFVWKEDDQLPDLLKFLHRFGYPDVYDALKDAYTNSGCSDELIGDLPTADNPFKFRKNRHYPISSNLPGVREQYLQERNTPNADSTCDLLKIIGLLPDTGVIEFLSFFNQVYTQFSTNPSLHFLVGKLQEPSKGRSVRNFKHLEPIQELMKQINDALKANPIMQVIFQLIADITRIDFNDDYASFVKFVVSLVEFVLWGTIPIEF